MGFGPEVLEPFNIPTDVHSTMQTGPRMSLNFPVFTPPAANTYGSTMPMRVPWEPPNLSGAIEGGLQTGAKLATDFLTNRKTAQQIQAEELAQRGAIAAANDPNLAQYRSYEMGPSGFTAKVMSPADAAIQQANIAKTTAETAEARERTRAIAPSTAAKTAEEQAAAEKARRETELMGTNQFELRKHAATSGMVKRTESSGGGSEDTDLTREYSGY